VKRENILQMDNLSQLEFKTKNKQKNKFPYHALKTKIGFHRQKLLSASF